MYTQAMIFECSLRQFINLAKQILRGKFIFDFWSKHFTHYQFSVQCMKIKSCPYVFCVTHLKKSKTNYLDNPLIYPPHGVSVHLKVDMCVSVDLFKCHDFFIFLMIFFSQQDFCEHLALKKICNEGINVILKFYLLSVFEFYLMENK